MAAVTFDKKQLPQIIGLGVVSLGAFIYFGAQMFQSPKAVGAPAATAPATPSAVAAAGAAGSATAASTDASGAAGTIDTASLIGATPPTDSMRDPFLVAAIPPPPAPPVAPGTAESGSTPMSPVPPLPSDSQVTPLPVGPVDGGWTVYGVICSGDDPSNALAIFRRGDERRYIRLGDKIDDTTRLIGVDRNGVTILSAGNRVRLPLGGAPIPPVDPSAKLQAEQSPGTFAPAINTLPLENAPGVAPSPQIAAPSSNVPALPPGVRPI